MLRGAIKSSIMVKAQDVRSRFERFPKFTEDLNFAHIYVLYNFMWSSPPL